MVGIAVKHTNGITIRKSYDDKENPVEHAKKRATEIFNDDDVVSVFVYNAGKEVLYLKKD